MRRKSFRNREYSGLSLPSSRRVSDCANLAAFGWAGCEPTRWPLFRNSSSVLTWTPIGLAIHTPLSSSRNRGFSEGYLGQNQKRWVAASCFPPLPSHGKDSARERS